MSKEFGSECALYVSMKSLWYCILGLPKIFGVSCFSTSNCSKFQVNPRLFYHVRSAPKTSGLPIKMASGGHFWGSTDVVKRPRMDLKLGIPSRFGPISSLEFEALRFGQPYCTVYIGFYDQSPSEGSRSLNPKAVAKLRGFLLGLTTRWSLKPVQTTFLWVQRPPKVLTVAILLHKGQNWRSLYPRSLLCSDRGL